jgi:hypothetical protein
MRELSQKTIKVWKGRDTTILTELTVVIDCRK